MVDTGQPEVSLSQTVSADLVSIEQDSAIIILSDQLVDNLNGKKHSFLVF